MADEIRLDVSANTTPMERDIANATRRVGSINLNANVDAKGLENFNRSLGKITGQADEFSKSMEAANARVLAFGASVGVINAISNAFKGLVSSTIEVEKSLTEIKIVGDETFSNLNKTSAGLFATAKQLGVSYKDAADATLEFARQGKGLSDSLNASRAALALTRTAGISATEAVMGLTSAVNAFGRGADAYIEYANKMSAVSDAFAVNNKDLIEGLSRSASVAQEAGVSFEELTALITTLQERTGRGGAVIGNALKTIFTRVQNPEIIKDLRDLGISVQDTTTGAFLPATQIIQNLANEFQGFDKNLRNSVLLKVGGGFQVDKLAAVLNDVKNATGTYQRALNLATNGSGDILGRVAKLNETIDSSFTNIVTSAKQLGSNIGQIAFSKDFTNILQNGASLISSINDAIFGDSKDAEDQGSSIGKAVLKGLGSVISGPGLFSLLGIFAKLSIDFVKFSKEGIQTLVGITSKSKEEQLIQTAITNVLSRNADFQQKIFSLEGNRVAQAELLLGVIRQQVNEAAKLERITGGISPILRERGVTLSSGKAALGSAKGYIPNLAETIAKERSESPAGSKIIVDRNFPMGGGERSTMVYNSNETRIKNFAGSGGDAIIPNYPINSARGFVPNFADPRKEVLNIDASQASIAGLTYVGKKNKGIMEKAKPVKIDDKLLSKYAGSPFVGLLDQFKTANIVNLPVGNVYKFRKGLEGNEKELKKSFVEKLNLKFRDQIKSFLTEEISSLGLATGGGLNKNLSNLKLDLIGYSTAGYLFEEILKIPTLTDAEKVAQYANQSETDFFDIKNLAPEFAEAYGLPKRSFDFTEIKFGEKELFDGITKKMLNQLVLSGGGANPKKFGVKDTNRAAFGYIPNFNEPPKTGFIKTDAVTQGNNLEKNLYDLIGINIKDRPVGGSTLDIPKGLLDKFSKDTLNSLGIATGYPFKTEYGDIKLSKNKDSITSLVSKFLRNRGDQIDKNLSYSSKGFSMLYKNGPKDSRETSERALSSLVDENVSLFDLIPWSLKNDKGKKTKKNKKGLQLNDLGEKIKITFSYNADRLIQDSEILPSNKVLFPERYESENASKGYIPNFAYDLGVNKDNIAIRSVTSPFDEKGNRIRGSGAVKEAILAAIEKAKSKGFTKITADAISDASVNAFIKQFGRAVKGKNTWDISEFKNASKGYIPNFAKDALEDAVVREQVQSGLPSSQISLTRDSRLVNNLNPSGFAVINKRDEPNGKVPASRISSAYKNAGKGFVPNFSKDLASAVISGAGDRSTPEASAALAKMQRESKSKEASKSKEVSKSLDEVADTASKATIKLDDFSNSLKELIENSDLSPAAKNKAIAYIQGNEVNPSDANLSKNLQKASGGKGQNKFTPIVEKASAQAQSMATEKAAKASVEKKLADDLAKKEKDRNDTVDQLNNLLKKELEIHKKNDNLQTNFNRFLNERKDLLLNLNRLTRDEISSLAQTIASGSNARVNAKTAEKALFSVRDSLKESGSNPATPREISPTPKREENKEQEDSKKKATKSLGDLAQTAFIFQSGLSFATGALSTFGKETEALGDVVNSVGQIMYSVFQGGDLLKQLTKGRGLGEVFSSIGTGARSGANAAGGGVISRIGGGIKGAIVGTAAVEGGAAATGLGAGSLAGAGAALLATAGALATGGYLLYKSIDSIGKSISGSATRTERAVNAFNDIQEKYNTQLSDKQKVTVDRLSELANVSGTSLSGVAAGSGYTFSQAFNKFKSSNFGKAFGFKDETYKNTLQQQIANSGLNIDAEGNQALAKSLGPLLAPLVTAATNKRGENGLIITAPQLEQDKLISKLFSEKLKEIDTILKEELKKPENFNFSKEEIQKIIEEKNLTGTNETQQVGRDRSTRRTVVITPEQQAIRELKKRKESDLTGIAAARVAQRTAPESIAAQATLEAQKQGILIQTELLKKRLEITQQIAKIESTIPSALESSLSIQKELLSTNEATKFASDLQLKNLQEERQTRAEIKELFSNEARNIISKNLDRTSQLGVSAPKTEQINTLFNNLQASQSLDQQKSAYGEIVNQLDLAVSRQMEKIQSLEFENAILESQAEYMKDYNDEIIDKNNKQIEQLSEINNQIRQQAESLKLSLDVITKQSQARRIQAAQAAQERAITEKSNYYYTLQKDIFSAQIEIQNKKLEKAKQELDIRKQMRDLAFDEMQFADKTKTEPRKQYEAGMFAAQSKETDTIADVRMRNAEKAQAYRQSLYNDISSRTNNLQTMSDASKAVTSGNTKELERLFSEAFGEQAQTFDQKVLTAADQFAQIVVQSAKDSEAIKRGEQPSTSYQAISTSDKSIEDLMSQSYGYKNQADIIKNIEELKKRRDEVDLTEIFPEDVDNKVKELEDLLTSIKQQASEAKKQSLKPVTEDETKIADNARRRKELEQGRLTQGESERTTFTGGFKSAKDQINLEIETFNSRLGKDIPMAFRDSMVSAMRELSNPNSTQPLKERLLGVANAFLQKINEAFMTQAANKLTSGIMGVIPGMASGGYIKGGSGSKDDVPAMLMGGEYVVKKDAVQKYGPSFFDALNKGSIKKFANGGWVESDVTKYQDPTSITPYYQKRDQGLLFDESGQVVNMANYTGIEENKRDAMMRAQSDYYAKNSQSGENGFYMPGQNGMGSIMGARNLLSFATQQNTDDRFDRISSGGMAGIDLGAGSSNMSLFGLRNQENSRSVDYLQSKQKSLDLYFQSLGGARDKANQEEENRKEQERLWQEYERQKEEIERQKEEIKKQRKAQMKGMLINLGMSIGMAGLGALGKAAMTGGSNALKAANVNAMNSGGSQLSGFDKFKTFAGGMWSGGSLNGTNAGGLSNAFSSSGYQSFQGFSQGSQNYLFKGNTPLGGSKYGWEQQYNKPGGFWNSNSVYMRRAAGGYVAGNGMGDNVPAMLNGGEFVISKQAAQNIGTNKLQQINSGNLENNSSESIISKLDELVEKLSAVGTLNITVNSDSKGNEKTTERGGNQDKEAKELARKIKEVVMLVLKEEKRLGGMLR